MPRAKIKAKIMEDKITALEQRISNLEKELNDYRTIGGLRDIALFKMLGWDKDKIEEYLSTFNQEVAQLRES